MNSLAIPSTRCAFHQTYFITHFCKYQECLLPLCKDCIQIHRREHSNLKQPMQLTTVEQQSYALHHHLTVQSNRLEELYKELIAKLNGSNHLHAKLKKQIIQEKQSLVKAIVAYYDSLSQEIDANYQRRQYWLQEYTNSYNHVKHELCVIQNSLQGEKHLRTIIMWNRLKPYVCVNEIAKQACKEFEEPSSVPCDIQQIIGELSHKKKMRVLDLQGDMGISNLTKLLKVLRFGEQEVQSPRLSGIHVTRERRPQKLKITKSTDRL